MNGLNKFFTLDRLNSLDLLCLRNGIEKAEVLGADWWQAGAAMNNIFEVRKGSERFRKTAKSEAGA